MKRRSKYSYEEVYNFILSKGCVLLTEVYKRGSENLLIKCSCGQNFNRSFADFKNKKMYRCTECSGNKLSYNYVYDFVSSKGCVLLSKAYKNNSTKLNIQCKCGEEYIVDFNTFKKGQTKCKKCFWSENKHYKKYTYEQVKQYIEVNSECKLLSIEYEDCFSKLDVLCACGKQYKISFAHIKQQEKIQCKYCSNAEVSETFKLTEDDVRNRVSGKYNNKYSVTDFSFYKNSQNGFIVFKHNECGAHFKSTVHSALYGDLKCTHCEGNTSTGERIISMWLDRNSISYFTQYGFEDCVYKRKLLFDFYIPSHNLLIEFDGEQHYKPFDIFGGEKSFIEVQIRDNIKNNYCYEKSITLVRIKYDKINEIDDILSCLFDK